MASPSPTDQVLALETAVWQALVDGDAEADRALLAPEFLGVYPTGFVGRDEHVAPLLAGPTVVEFEIRDHRVVALTADHVLLVYEAGYRRAAGGPVERMYVSSLWANDGNGWRNVFSQDTPASDVVVP